LNIPDFFRRENPTMSRYWNELLRMTNHMGTQEWALVLIGVLVVGAFLLRGFGSRSQY
jgi:hypothetical protein